MFLTRKPSITPEQAAARLTRGELVLVDVRQPAELRARSRARRRQHPADPAPRPPCQSSTVAVRSRFCATPGLRSSRATRHRHQGGL